MGIFDFLSSSATNESLATTGLFNFSSPTKKEIDINKSYQYTSSSTYSPTTTTTTTTTISPTYTYAPTIISSSPYATTTPRITITSEPSTENPLTITPRFSNELMPNLTQMPIEKKELAQTSEALGGIISNTTTLLIIAVGGYLLWKILK